MVKKNAKASHSISTNVISAQDSPGVLTPHIDAMHAVKTVPVPPEELMPFIDDAVKRRDMILDSVKKYGTPQYLLDEKRLSYDADRIRSAFTSKDSKVRLFYAFKSNDLPHLISVLKDKGINADVSCMFELELALKLGFSRIIYSAPYKSDAELLLAMSNDVIINVDNPCEYDKITALCKKNMLKAKVSFRLQSKWKKFGMEKDELISLAKKAQKNKDILWIGLHIHSSWNDTTTNYADNIRKIADVLSSFSKKELSGLEFIDIGGGFVVFESMTIAEHFEMPPLIEDYGKTVIDAMNELRLRLKITPELWIEPGRILCSASTMILVKVDCVKDGEVITDGGINLVGDSVFKEELYPVLNASRPKGRWNNVKMNGPLCDPDDHWGVWCYGGMPAPGDVIAVLNQGAYTYASAWRWQRPIAKYISYDGKKLRVVKSQETFDDRYTGCRFE